ncbi:tetratricopeptide (TPR) repeat protein [Actinokineospora baliensis]|uniref:tetratricopeptide repeat protein n=1 Tax=Actinokineospora baliensis TaxID=547056 RepID=UPI00195E0778|nr:tetratricopeptide repeat protein [Actinokineospora baliensis]MBM7774226.1 tetratricopeptide (TPR) repeat protein [Actinokineospora baliensis]
MTQADGGTPEIVNSLSGHAEILIQAGHVHGGITVAPRPVPKALRQLPARVAGFTGRAEQLSGLSAQLGPGAEQASAVVAGLAGVGKTALAVQAAHAAVDSGWFPGGVLFVDLHGYDTVPVGAGQALDSLLRALGVAGEHIPRDVDARASLYRSVLAQQEGAVLVVADNASDVAQVALLVPGDARHRVLVTSRHTLSQLGARLVRLAVLPPREAVDLLDRAVRAADPADTRIGAGAEIVVRRCGFLPLALRIVATLLVDDRERPVADLAAEMAEANSALAYLDDGVRAVRVAFDLSYRRFTPEQARLFRLLALNPGPDLATAAAAALVDEPVSQVRRVLDELARAHMVERGRGRWRMHDLIAEYARELVAQIPIDDRAAATRRLLDHYWDNARAAELHLAPGCAATEPVAEFAGLADAVAWLQAERPNLEGAVAIADPVRATGIARSIAVFLHHAGYWQQAVGLHRLAAAVAPDDAGRAAALVDLGNAQILIGEYAAATATLTEALHLSQDLGDRRGQADALTHIGVAQRAVGKYPDAKLTLTEAIDLSTMVGDRRGQAAALIGLGITQYLSGEYSASAKALNKALQVCRDLGDRLRQAYALTKLGSVQHVAADYASAAATLTEALHLARDVGDRLSEANAQMSLGNMLHVTGRYPAAVAALAEALRQCRLIGDRLGQIGALTYLGNAHTQHGDHEAAMTVLTDALQLTKDIDDPRGQANVLALLGTVRQATGEHAAAASTLDEALAAFRALGDRGGETWALNRYAALITETGAPERGRALHTEALRMAREISVQQDEADAHAGIAVSLVRLGEVEEARTHFAKAVELFEELGCATEVTRVRAALAELPEPG